MSGRTHIDWLAFLQKAVELPIGYSVDDMLWFQTIAKKQYPALEPLVAACIHLAQASDLKVAVDGNDTRSRPARSAPKQNDDLLALLRDKAFFPRNQDLARLATRLMPNMHSYRFDKMSRGEIAMRIIQHLESLPTKERYALESALRAAAADVRNDPENNRRSFVDRWESVIKDMKI